MVKEIKSAQLADQIRDYLAQWTARDYPGWFVSVSQVTLRPDLQEAIVWITVLEEEGGHPILEMLRQQTGAYQKQLNRSIKRRFVPKLIFRLDDRVSIENRFDQLLKS